jgi:hypothetical protein
MPRALRGLRGSPRPCSSVGDHWPASCREVTVLARCAVWRGLAQGTAHTAPTWISLPGSGVTPRRDRQRDDGSETQALSGRDRRVLPENPKLLLSLTFASDWAVYLHAADKYHRLTRPTF